MHRSLRALTAAGLVLSPILLVAPARADQTDTGDTQPPSPPPPATDAAEPEPTAPSGTAPPTTPVPQPAPTTAVPAPPSVTTTTTSVPEYNPLVVAAIPTLPPPTTAAADPTTAPAASAAPVPTTVALPPADATTTTSTAVPSASAVLPGAPTTSPSTEIGVVGPSGPPGVALAAKEYDAVYANGLPLGIAMATSRWLESGNDYTATNSSTTASGAYQVLDQYWNDYGGYPRAHLAPPEVQDQFAYESFVAILKRNGNDLASIPVSWYYPIALGNPTLMDTVPAPWAGNLLTIRQYQYLWLEKFFELLGQGGPPFLPEDEDPLIPSIAFPVLGPVRFWHDFGMPRGTHGERTHEGLDLLGTAGQPLRAAFDGTVTRIRIDPRGISGVVVTVTRADGLRANYFHLNDDTPGTVDGAAESGLRIHPGLEVGDSVKAGQVIAYMGDTGNAVGVPHLHFELRTPDGIPIDPYPAVLAAQQREQCSVGIGPWSTDFVAPWQQAWFDAQFAALSQREQDELRWMAASVSPPAVHTILVGPDGARWEIDAGGTVHATGVAALIQPGSGECVVVPDVDLLYGTGAAGVGRDLLPVDWWDVGVAYSGEVAGDDLLHGDGVLLGERPPNRDELHW